MTRIKTFAPNLQAIKKEAEKAKRSGGKYNYYAWKLGDNILRIMPPYNARGLIAKCTYTHFELPPKRDIASCLKTWPEDFDTCPVCSKLETIKRKIPNTDLGRQESKEQWTCQVIDREDEDTGAQPCRITSTVYAWLAAQMDNPRIGDITDPDDGFDVIITKTEKKGSKRNSIRYSCSFVPKSCALHDDPKILEMWLEQMQDLDTLFGPPDDAYIADMTSVASGMITYYLRSHRDDVVTDREDAEEQADKPARARRVIEEEKPARARRTIVADEDDTPAEDPPADEPKRRETKPATTKKEPTPMDVPKCHASLDNPEKHEDGTYGFNEALEKCLICAEDLSCSNFKSERGL